MLDKDAKPSAHGRLQDSQSRLAGVLGTGTLGGKQLPVEMRLEGWVSRAELALFLRFRSAHGAADGQYLS
jgi:hypothetical protein